MINVYLLLDRLSLIVRSFEPDRAFVLTMPEFAALFANFGNPLYNVRPFIDKC